MNIRYLEVKHGGSFAKALELVNAQIVQAIEAVKTMKKRVQIAAIGTLIVAGLAKTDAERTQAVDLANHLVNELGNGIKGKGLVAFFMKFGFRLDADGKQFAKCKSEETIREKFEEAKKTMWFDLAPDAPFADYNFTVELRKLLDRAGKMVDDDEHAKQISVDSDLYEVVLNLLDGKPVHAKGALKLIDNLVPEPEAKAA